MSALHPWMGKPLGSYGREKLVGIVQALDRVHVEITGRSLLPEIAGAPIETVPKARLYAIVAVLDGRLDPLRGRRATASASQTATAERRS